jgi:hypothetical protein
MFWVLLLGAETYGHVGFTRSAQGAKCADRKEPMQTLPTCRPPELSLAVTPKPPNLLRDFGV